LWYPPGMVKQSAWQDLRDNLAMVGVFRTALGRGLKLAEAMYAQHPSPQPYWYLRYVGVAPEAQGKGWGSAIVRAGIARAASHGCGVLLETATPSNVAIYSRLGFEIMSEWDAPSGGPHFWTMVRPLR
jgi:ribosomal protein S18 acetylase RimI-like enzyme